MTGAPVTLADLRTAVREWCQLDGNDPRATDAILNDYINAAIHRFTVANPLGWSWDKRYNTSAPFALAAGQAAQTFHNGGKLDTTDDGGATDSFVRIRSLELILPNDAGRVSLPRLTRIEQLGAWPCDSERGIPRSFALQGFANPFPETWDLARIWFRPVPDVDYTFRIYGTCPLPDLLADTDPDGASFATDNQLAQWSDAVVAYAAFLVFRARGDLPEAMLGAKEYFDSQVKSLRRTNRVRVGAGVGNNPTRELM